MGSMGIFYCEQLEARRFLSAALANGLLRIVGTARDDQITLAPVINLQLPLPYPAVIAVTINAQRSTFSVLAISRVEIFGMDGNDQILVTGPDPVRPGRGLRDFPFPLFIKGGDGDDSISATAHND